ncbi:MAG: RluA family pseudouridine synthase [Eubacteriales bacterium]|nr:RluA family pseudouridine synthase [Eubacteriales bacterium]
MDFRVLYEDNHIIVVEKPVNVLTQSDGPTDPERPDMLTAVKEYIGQKYEKPGNVFIGLVHRLDRPTGGVMIFARTSKAAARLSEAIREHEFEKYYYCVVRGVPAKPKDTLTHYLLKDEKTNTVSVVPMATEGAKMASLSYETLETVRDCSLLRVRLHTGRAHQIRVQMKAIGCPLWGDQRYAADVNKPGQQLALWACQISFIHPVTKERMTFYAPPPEDKAPWKAFKLELDEAYVTDIHR